MVRFMDPVEDIDRMLNSFGGRWRGGIMPMDAWEDDGLYTLRFDIPGVEPSQVDLTVEGGLLTVTAERPVEQNEGATWLLRERPSGTHRREVRLGSRLDTGDVNASYDNGVLTVTIPVRQEARPHRVEISSASQSHQELAASVS